MDNLVKHLLDSILEDKLLEANPYFDKAIKDKISKNLQDKKKKFDNKDKPVTGGNIDDSSGNNDLCDSSDMQGGSNSSSNDVNVSEQETFGPTSVNYSKRLERHIRTIHPHQARDKILSNADSKQKELTRLSKKKINI